VVLLKRKATAMWFWKNPKKRKGNPEKLDFFAIVTLYTEGRDLFLQGKHEDAMDCFKRIYEETVDFRDVCENVDSYYAEEKDQWIKKYQSRFKEQKW
jgi:hypothetical protein